MSLPDKEAKHWELVARRWPVKGYANELLAEHKRKTHLGLIAKKRLHHSQQDQLSAV